MNLEDPRLAINSSMLGRGSGRSLVLCLVSGNQHTYFVYRLSFSLVLLVLPKGS